MKKIILCILFSTTLLSGCKSNETTSVCTRSEGYNIAEVEVVSNGKKVSDITMTLTQKGGLEGLSDEDVDTLVKSTEATMKEQLNNDEDVKINATSKGIDFIITLSVDAQKAKPNAISTLGFSLEENNPSKVTYKALILAIQNTGFTCREEK